MLNDLIIEFISNGVVDQQELAKKLKNHGYELTQSSISRKLKQLGIVKINGEYKIVKREIDDKNIIFVPPNLLIIKTPPGNAQAIAAKIDDNLVSNKNEPNFIATIAGDDTIFIAVSLDRMDSKDLIMKIKKLIF